MPVTKRKVSQLWYRLKIRKEVGNLDDDLVKITYEEVWKELNRRKLKVKIEL